MIGIIGAPGKVVRPRRSGRNSRIARQGGKHVLYGSALTLATATQTWAARTGTPVGDLVRGIVR
jgi:hypothetical protein